MKNAYEIARKRVVRKKRFYQHLTTYLAVMVFLFLLNTTLFITTWWHYVPGESRQAIIKDILSYPYWWFQYPLLAWGLLLFIHYSAVFGSPLLANADGAWEARAMEKELKRLQKRDKDTSSEQLPLAPLEDKLKLKALQRMSKSKNKDKGDDLGLV